jgi:hypothetical protein
MGAAQNGAQSPKESEYVRAAKSRAPYPATL